MRFSAENPPCKQKINIELNTNKPKQVQALNFIRCYMLGGFKKIKL